MEAAPMPSWLCLDQRTRWKKGDRVRVESYLERHPGLAAAPDALLDLVYNEVVLREEAGESPRLEEYLRRFAGFERDLRQLFEVHRALESDGPAPTHIEGETPPPSAPPAPRRPATSLPVLPGYEVLAELGRGGMGVVYKARQESLRRVVAVKTLLAGGEAGERGLARFLAEAAVVAGLRHPNIVQVYEVGEYDGRPFFAMEYVEGPSLAARLGGSPQPAREAAQTVATLARALHHAHENGIVHRDLKPANVLFAADGTAKVTDFGLAKRLDGPGPTRTGDLLGTPSYMAPEQAGGSPQRVGPAADVYALGAVLYEMLTGRPPFKAESATDTLLQVLREGPVPPSRLRVRTPRDLETVCLKCLEKDPRRRYASAQALADDLERFLAGRPVAARRVGPAGRALRWGRRHPAAAALLTLSAITVVGLASLYGWHSSRERQRITAGQADVAASLETGQEALARQEWEGAQAQARAALAHIEAEPRLGDLRPRAERLMREAQDRAFADDTTRQFARKRDAALFLRLELLSRGLARGPAPAAAARRAAAEGAARHALALVGLAPGAEGEWRLDARLNQPTRRAEITDSASLLLLALADSAAERPGPEARHEAQRLLDQAEHVGGPVRAARLRRAGYLRSLDEGDVSEALRAAGAAPGGARAAHELFLLGDECYRRGDRPGAVRAFESAVALQPGHFWAECSLARCYLDLRQWDKARASLTVCLVVRPDVVWPRLLRGFANTELGAFRAAEEDFRQAGERLGASPDEGARYLLHVHRALLRFRQEGRLAGCGLAVGGAALLPLRHEKLEAAAADLREAARLLPEDYAPHLNLARVYARMGDAEGAQRELAGALRRHPPALVLADYHGERGRALLLARDYPGAVAEAQAALRAWDGYALARGVLGLALLELRRYDLAAREFDLYLEKGGRPTADVFRARGHARMNLGDYLGACDDYARLLELAPGAEAHAHRGWAYFFADAWRPALRDFEQALRLDPAYGDAYTGRGLARVMLGRYREAVRDAEEALRRRPRDPAMMHNLACVFAQAVARAEADPGVPDRAALVAGYRTQAVAALRGALALVPLAQRQPFWRDKVFPDTALDPVRRTAEFEQLAREYGAATHLQ